MKKRLYNNFRTVINHVMIDAWNRIPTGPQEPDFIASLVINGTSGFHNAMIANPGLWNQITTVGVFCHQSPMVKYSDGIAERQCELGDVLFCHFHTNIEGKIFRNAVLFQSKMTDTVYLPIPYNDDQLRLYREWPEYEYYRSGGLNGQKRNLFPKQPHAGAQYMFLDNRPITDPNVGIYGPRNTHHFPIGTTTMSPILFGDTPLEIELVRFLFFGSGRPFGSLTDGVNDVWTKIVWELLKNGMRRAFNRRNAGFNNIPRISRDRTNMDGMLSFAGSIQDLSSGIGEDFYNEYKDLFSLNDRDKDINKNYIPENTEEGGAPSIIIFRTIE